MRFRHQKARLYRTLPVFLQIGGCLFLLPMVYILTAIGLPASGAHQSWVFFLLLLVVIPLLMIMTFGCAGTVIDKNTKTVIRWYGLYLPLIIDVPFRKKQYRLDDFNAIIFSGVQEMRGMGYSGGSPYAPIVTYTIRLTNEQDPAGLSIGLVPTGGFLSTRKDAKKLARFLGMPFIDGTTSNRLTLAPDNLDRPLVERLVEKPPLIPSSPPEGTNVRIEAGNDSVVYTLPRSITERVMRPLVIVLSNGLLFALIIVAIHVYRENLVTPDPRVKITYIILSIIACGTIILLLGQIRSGKKPSRFRLTRDTILVEKRLLPFDVGFNESIDIEGLESINVGPNGLRAQSDRRMIDFAEELNNDQLDWLRQEVLYRLWQLSAKQ